MFKETILLLFLQKIMARVLKFVYSAEDQLELSSPPTPYKQIGNALQQPGSPSHQRTVNTSDCDIVCEVEGEDEQKATNYFKDKLDNCDLNKSRYQDKTSGKYHLCKIMLCLFQGLTVL